MRYSSFGYWGRQAAAVALAVLTGVAVWVLPPQMYLAKYGVLTVGSLAAVAVVLSVYRNADEVILETHKTAWFWGCMTALVPLVPLTIVIQMRLLPLPALLPRVLQQPSVYFSLGVLAVLLLESAGFLLFWAYHNLGRRE